MVHKNAITDVVEYENEMEPASMFPECIRTDRLVLKRVHPDSINISRLHELFANVEESEEVFQWCSWSLHTTLQDTRDYVRERVEKWESASKAEYVAIHRKSDEYVGTGYLRFSPELQSCVFGFWIKKPYWGRRLSGERADAFLDVAFNELDVNHIEVGCLEQNDNSRRAIEQYIDRYGGVFYGTKPVVSSRYTSEDDVYLHHEYAITKKQYEAGNEGISCTVPGVTFEDVTLD